MVEREGEAEVMEEIEGMPDSVIIEEVKGDGVSPKDPVGGAPVALPPKAVGVGVRVPPPATPSSPPPPLVVKLAEGVAPPFPENVPVLVIEGR